MIKYGDLIYVPEYQCSYVVCAIDRSHNPKGNVCLVRFGTPVGGVDEIAFICAQASSTMFSSMEVLRNRHKDGKVVVLGNVAKTIKDSVAKLTKEGKLK